MIGIKNVVLHAPELVLAEKVNKTENVENASQQVEYLHNWGKVEHFAGTLFGGLVDEERLLIIVGHGLSGIGDYEHEDGCL